MSRDSAAAAMSKHSSTMCWSSPNLQFTSLGATATFSPTRTTTRLTSAATSPPYISRRSFSQLNVLLKKQSVRALHLKLVSLADACLAPSSAVPPARVEALVSFMCVRVQCVRVAICECKCKHTCVTDTSQHPLRCHHRRAAPGRGRQRQHRRATAHSGTAAPSFISLPRP